MYEYEFINMKSNSFNVNSFISISPYKILTNYILNINLLLISLLLKVHKYEFIII